ncbi:hypothetical protein NDU88_011691 [Pleurodeles waltl]|uniref:Uncharacterized protein n=1 Tax=Pleurodeles waltl TaxID=8319 RepID=A0AAV7QZV5_PLEWA|nr:hypothetical protein NDU88_011691 [Pleurodeles waltl]
MTSYGVRQQLEQDIATREKDLGRLEETLPTDPNKLKDWRSKQTDLLDTWLGLPWSSSAPRPVTASSPWLGPSLGPRHTSSPGRVPSTRQNRGGVRFRRLCHSGISRRQGGSPWHPTTRRRSKGPPLPSSSGPSASDPQVRTRPGNPGPCRSPSFSPLPRTQVRQPTACVQGEPPAPGLAAFRYSFGNGPAGLGICKTRSRPPTGQWTAVSISVAQVQHGALAQQRRRLRCASTDRYSLEHSDRGPTPRHGTHRAAPAPAAMLTTSRLSPWEARRPPSATIHDSSGAPSERALTGLPETREQD